MGERNIKKNKEKKVVEWQRTNQLNLPFVGKFASIVNAFMQPTEKKKKNSRMTERESD